MKKIETLLIEFVSSGIERREQLEEELRELFKKEGLSFKGMEFFENKDNSGSINLCLSFYIPKDDYNFIDFEELFGSLNVFAMSADEDMFRLMVQVGELVNTY